MVAFQGVQSASAVQATGRVGSAELNSTAEPETTFIAWIMRTRLHTITNASVSPPTEHEYGLSAVLFFAVRAHSELEHATANVLPSVSVTTSEPGMGEEGSLEPVSYTPLTLP